MNICLSARARRVGRWSLAAIAALALVSVIGTAPALAQNAYVTNRVDGTVSVIATASNTVIATISVGGGPFGVAVTPDDSKVYIANTGSNSVSVIATASNTVIATIPVGGGPFGVAVTPDGSKVYVANGQNDSVSVIATATNTVTGSPIHVGGNPYGASIEDTIPPYRHEGPAVTQPGDLWMLGRNKLICGDAREAGIYAALLGDEIIDLICTDPPYNVPIDGHVCGSGRIRHRNFAMGAGE